MLSGGQVDQKKPGLVIFQAGQEMRQSKGGHRSAAAAQRSNGSRSNREGSLFLSARSAPPVSSQCVAQWLSK